MICAATHTRDYDHPPDMCDGECDPDTCRRAYRRALGLERRAREVAAEAAREAEEREWGDGSGWGSP